MIPSSHALVSLKPARQAAIQAISHVESARHAVCLYLSAPSHG